jgi:hypothetical protein
VGPGGRRARDSEPREILRADSADSLSPLEGRGIAFE